MTRDLPAYAQVRAVDFSGIPVVDVQGFSDPAAIGAALVDAATTTGFFYISGHDVPADLTQGAFAAAKAFFARPEAQKASVAVDQNHRGWMAQGMTRLEGSKTFDAKEVFFWGRDIAPDDPDIGQPLVAGNQWPETVDPGLRQGIAPYYAAVVDLGRNLMSALALGLGKPADFFTAAYDKPLARGQLVYYPRMDQAALDAGRFGAAEHTDFGALTILKQDDVGGLQVKNRAGDWIAAPPIPDTFVCNIGDLLERWTNGRLISTPHRVLNTAGVDRFSIPIFFDPASGALIDPSDFAAPNEALLHPPVTAGAHIAGRNRKNFSQYSKP